MCWYFVAYRSTFRRVTLPHLPLQPYACVSESGKYWLGDKPLSEPTLDRVIINWTIENKLHWHFNQNTRFFTLRKRTWKYRLRNGSHFVQRGYELNNEVRSSHSSEYWKQMAAYVIKKKPPPPHKQNPTEMWTQPVHRCPCHNCYSTWSQEIRASNTWAPSDNPPETDEGMFSAKINFCYEIRNQLFMKIHAFSVTCMFRN